MSCIVNQRWKTASARGPTDRRWQFTFAGWMDTVEVTADLSSPFSLPFPLASSLLLPFTLMDPFPFPFEFPDSLFLTFAQPFSLSFSFSFSFPGPISFFIVVR